MWRRVGRVIVACVAALALAVPLLAHPGKAEGLALGGDRLYLPVILGPFRLAGIYDCVEYEFGLIWTSDVITLHPNGDSTYAYEPPHGGIVTGTWTYTPETRLVGFTEFRWETATVELTLERLWAARQFTAPDYEIRLECQLRWGP